MEEALKHPYLEVGVLTLSENGRLTYGSSHITTLKTSLQQSPWTPTHLISTTETP